MASVKNNRFELKKIWHIYSPNTLWLSVFCEDHKMSTRLAYRLHEACRCNRVKNIKQLLQLNDIAQIRGVGIKTFYEWMKLRTKLRKEYGIS